MRLVRTTAADLNQRGQTPTIAVLADHLHVGTAEISAAMLASNMYRPDRLTRPPVTAAGQRATPAEPRRHGPPLRRHRQPALVSNADRGDAPEPASSPDVALLR